MSESAPPMPTDAAEARRWQHTRLRRRIMYSLHRKDVEQLIRKQAGPERAAAWGTPTISRNPMHLVWTQLASAQYRESPMVTPPEGAEAVAAAVADASYWQLASRLHRDTLALNENLCRVDVVGEGEDAELIYRPVYPDLVQVETDPHRPSKAVAVKEWIQDPRDPKAWVCLHVEPRLGLYVARDADGIDVSNEVLGGSFSGELYPWKDYDGNNLLPYVVRHKAHTGWAWDPYSNSEIVDGSLQLGLDYAELAHIKLWASWPQRYIGGGEIAAADTTPGRGRTASVDPTVILRIKATEDNTTGNVQAGQWANSADPEGFLRTIRDFEKDLVDAALGTAGVSRSSSDIRSGFSLAVSRESQREAQRSFEPMAQKADLEVLRLSAQLLGRAHGVNYPVKGWRIRYKSTPKDYRELQAEMERFAKLIEAGLMDKVTAYQELHPQISREEAEQALREIADTNRRIA